MVIRPSLWRLSLLQNTRIFQTVSPLTIINTLCEESGLTDVAFAVTREADLDFNIRISLAGGDGVYTPSEMTVRGESAAWQRIDPHLLT